MLNLIRKFLRPTLREQLEAGVREALRRYADRRIAPNLRVYVSTDLIPEGMDHALWTRDEAEHLRRFALQWAEDNGIARAGLRLEVILLDTKREFAFVKPIGLDGRERERERGRAVAGAPAPSGGRREPGAAPAPGPPPVAPLAGDTQSAVLEVVESPTLNEPLRVEGELTLGRKTEPGVFGVGDRYMSSRHVRLRVDRGQLWVTDLDSKNRTFVNDEPVPAHQAVPVSVGDRIRMGTTTVRVARVES